MKETITVRAGDTSYRVVVGSGLLPQLGALMREEGLHGRAAVIVDETVFGLWGSLALKGLDDVSVFRIPSGESAKTLEWAEHLWGKLIWEGFGRGDCVVALGGGATGDLAGFVAATYHRGIPLVQVPTTLLSQVDSSVGGKTAIDHPLGKNLIGAFHQPRLVAADLDTLKTLPSRERWSGLAEVVKAAMIADVALLEELEENLEALAARDAEEVHLRSVVSRAIRNKAKVIEEDVRDHSTRRVLNFGHTLGHALEMLTGFGPLTHGEAVAMGMRAGLHVSKVRGHLSAEEEARGQRLLSRFSIPSFPKPDPEELMEVVKRDKKAEGGKSVFVTVGPLGTARVETVDDALLRESIDRMWSDGQ